MTVDLRSDTVTRPTAAMREAMLGAELGDDVFGDDSTVNTVQDKVAAMLGKEVALFVASGTRGNLRAVMSHCERGDEYLCGQMAHTYRWEGGGAAVLGSVQPQPQPIEHQSDGTLALADIDAAIQPDDDHYARSRLLCLENTLGGKALDLDYLEAATSLARSKCLATHLDGARIFNASVKTGVPVVQIARHFDTVSVCFSTGLGAPLGSALVGAAATIRRARRWRKMLGGGMRQAGIVAAAAVHALDHYIERLADDHALASRLAQGLSGLPGLSVEPPQTNMVFVDAAPALAAGLVAHLKKNDVLAMGLYRMRFVTHLDVDTAGIDQTVSVIRRSLETR